MIRFYHNWKPARLTYCHLLTNKRKADLTYCVSLQIWTSSFIENINRQLISTNCNLFTLVQKVDIYKWTLLVLLIMCFFGCCGRCRRLIRWIKKRFKILNEIEISVVIPFSSEAMTEFAKALGEEGIILRTFEGQTTSRERLGVVVINNSRFETNVANALAQFQTDEYHRLVLVIVHCVPETDLPRVEESKTRLGQFDQYKEIAEIVDIAYYKYVGIYNCKMNKKALKKLRDIFSNIID